MFIRKVTTYLCRPIIFLFPKKWLIKFVQGLVYIFSEFNSPDKALRFLLSIHSLVYRNIGKHAIRYGSGVHVKQRLMGYVDTLSDWAVECPGPYLDVGCNIGELSRTIAVKSSEKVLGIDISSETIERASALSDAVNLQFICGSTSLLSPTETYRTVVLSNVLEHIDDRVEFLISLRRDQKAENLVIRVPNYERDWLIPLREELGMDYFSDPTHFVEHRPEELCGELDAAGYSVVRTVIRWGEIWLLAKVGASSTANKSIIRKIRERE